MLSRAISLKVMSPVTSLETSTYVNLQSDVEYELLGAELT